MTQNQVEALEEVLLNPKRHERNILKLCEEMSELGEVLLKYVNKNKDNKPPIEKIIEELGDVFFRGTVIVEQFDIEEPVINRIDEKRKQLYDYYIKKEELVHES